MFHESINKSCSFFYTEFLLYKTMAFLLYLHCNFKQKKKKNFIYGRSPLAHLKKTKSTKKGNFLENL